MTTAVQRRRGTNTEHATFTGLDGEITVNTTTYTLHIHDGSTVGGTILAKADGSNIVTSSIDINGGTIDGTVIGGTTPAAVTTSSLVATTADINAGTIDGTVIGGSTAAAGTFTTGQFNTSVNVDGTVTADGLAVKLGTSADQANQPSGTFAATVYHASNDSGANGLLVKNNWAASTSTVFEAGLDLIGTGYQSYFKVNGVGYVGIGTSSPSTKLDVAGTVTADGLTVDGLIKSNGSLPEIRLIETDFTNGNTRMYNQGGAFVIARHDDAQGQTKARLGIDQESGDISFYEDTGTTAKFFWDASTERLGIGTSSPSQTLETVGSIFINAPSGNPDITIKTAGTGNNPFVAYRAGDNVVFDNMLVASTATDYWRVGYGASGTVTDEHLVVTSAGNVGIGTSSPSGVLHLSANTATTTLPSIVFQDTGTTATRLGSLTNNNGDLVLAMTSNLTDLRSAITLFDDRNMTFSTAGTERLRIDSSGNLLVGKTAASPSIAGNFFGLNASEYNESVSGNANGAIAIWYLNRQSSDGSAIEFRRATATVGSISVTPSGTTYNTTSDERLKENITDAPAGNIDDIKVRSFDWKVDGSHQDYGMVAQELGAVAPYAVTKGATEDDMWSVDYSKLVPMLIKEIQDLKAEVAALKGAN